MRSCIRATCNLKRLISDQNNPVGCRGCELPILGSNQGGQVVKQYMRAGNKEDPWISAGHHPAEIVCEGTALLRLLLCLLSRLEFCRRRRGLVVKSENFLLLSFAHVVFSVSTISKMCCALENMASYFTANKGPSSPERIQAEEIVATNRQET